MNKRKTNRAIDLSTTAVREVYQMFLTARQAAGVTEQTMDFYRGKLGQFVTAHAAVAIGDVTASTIRAYIVQLQKRGLAPSTVHGHARAVKAFMRFAAEDSYIAAAPKFAMPRLPKDVLSALSGEQVAAVLAACETARDRALVMFLLDSGLRASEFVALNGGDVDDRTGAVMVRLGKGQKSRVAYIGAKTRRELGRYWRESGRPGSSEPLWVGMKRGGRLTDDGLRQALERIGRRAQVHCNPHCLRRTFALASLRSGMDVYSLQRLLGHADLQVLRRYLDQNNNDLAQAHSAHGAVDQLTGRKQR